MKPQMTYFLIATCRVHTPVQGVSVMCGDISGVVIRIKIKKRKSSHKLRNAFHLPGVRYFLFLLNIVCL